MRLRRVRKRDGREVPFDKQKIAHAVARAQAAVGEDDAQFALEVADIVEMTLARRFLTKESGAPNPPENVPGIEEIQDLVEQALIELGHAPVAKSYILYRDRRSRVRAALEVRRDAVLGGDASAAVASKAHALRGPRVQVSGGLETWRKSRIVAALMDEADLPRATAEEVAKSVEERVFASGFKRISTALIRELVDNELVDLGLSQALRRQRPVGLPRHDLRRILASGAVPASARADGATEELGARDVEGRVAGDILRRFALEDVLPERLAELHLSGELHVESLARPHRALVTAVPCELLLQGEPGVRAVFDMLDEVAQLLRQNAYGVVLEDCAPIFQALTRAPRRSQSSGSSARGASPALHSGASFLTALAALARALDRHVDLVIAPERARAPASTLQPPPAWIERLLTDLSVFESAGARSHPVRVFVDAGEISRLSIPGSPLARALDVLLARGWVVPTFGDGSERCAGPGLVRGQRERGAIHCGAAVALNLPRAARRAGPWREDALLEGLATLVESALDALACLREFQRADGASAGRMRGRIAYALSPVGLREALRWLGDGELRPEQAARIVAFIQEAATRFGAARGMSVVLTPWFGEDASARFAALDPDLFQFDQPLLFDTGAEAARRPREVPYSVGFDLSPENPGLASAGARQGAGGACVLAALTCGAVHPPSMLRPPGSGGSEAFHPHLAALERLDRARARLRSGAHALYALPAIESEQALEPEPVVAAACAPIAAGRELFTESEALDSTTSTASLRRARSDET